MYQNSQPSPCAHCSHCSPLISTLCYINWVRIVSASVSWPLLNVFDTVTRHISNILIVLQLPFDNRDDESLTRVGPKPGLNYILV